MAHFAESVAQSLAQVIVTKFDCQDSGNGSVLVCVTGQMVFASESKYFMQCFLLTPAPGVSRSTFFLLNDVFRFLEAPRGSTNLSAGVCMCQ